AIANDSVAAIEAVAFRFPFTEAGYDSQVILAERLVLQGSPYGAGTILANLLELPAARKRFGVELLGSAARAYVASNSKSAAVSLLKQGAEWFPGQSLVFQGQARDLDESTDWNSAVEALADAARAQATIPLSKDYLLAGGVPARNGLIDTSLPVPSPKWVTFTHGSVPEKTALEDLASREADSGRTLLPKAEIRAAGNLILIKSTDSRILAVDLKTGLTKWACYPNGAPTSLYTQRFGAAGNNVTSSISFNVKNRVWGSSAFARISCDDERLYYVTGESFSDGGSNVFSNPRVSRPANQLHAASFEREGSLVWTVGTPSSEGTQTLTHNDLNGVFFLGPPLAYEDSLYCIVETRGEIRLVVLDAKSGEKRWTQQLCQITGSSTQLARKSQALSPAISDGILVCPTGANLLVAIDLHRRALRWAFSYQPKGRINPRQLFSMPPQSNYGPTEPNWHDSGLQVSQGTVTLTPSETPAFHLRDLATGEERIRIARGSYRYLAGTRGNLVVLVGEQNIFCIDRDANEPAWNVQLPPQSKLAGRALMTGESVIVPLQPNRLIRISLDDGQVEEEVTVDEPVGNLFAHRGTLLSASATSVSAYYTQDVLRSEVIERLASDEADAE
ncbi:MAG: PQQ-binding-like beta-propeller repeat protein, partial [Planctomycetota bacterium]